MPDIADIFHFLEIEIIVDLYVWYNVEQLFIVFYYVLHIP